MPSMSHLTTEGPTYIRVTNKKRAHHGDPNYKRLLIHPIDDALIRKMK